MPQNSIIRTSHFFSFLTLLVALLLILSPPPTNVRAASQHHFFQNATLLEDHIISGSTLHSELKSTIVENGKDPFFSKGSHLTKFKLNAFILLWHIRVHRCIQAAYGKGGPEGSADSRTGDLRLAGSATQQPFSTSAQRLCSYSG